MGNEPKVEEFLNTLDTSRIMDDYRYIYFTVAREYDLMGIPDLVDKYAKQAIELYSRGKISRSMIARCHYLMNNFQEVYDYYGEGNRTSSLSYVGGAYARSGNAEMAEQIIQKLKEKNGSRKRNRTK